jgi:L-rhamnose mutarotase
MAEQNPTTRACFLLRVRRAVWPEMLEALEETGWRNYSLFLGEDGLLVGYVECDDFLAVQARMNDHPIDARWQAEMAPFFTADASTPLSGLLQLREVFNLADQLARL